MCKTLSFNTVDVFTDSAFTGNPLAIVHVPNNVVLTQEQKQKIAIEFNYSETVFLHQPAIDAPTATYKVDIFTPEAEIPFAGHPSIGTACFIFGNLEKERDGATLVLKAGSVQAKFDRENGSASCAIPHNFRHHNSKIPWSRVVDSQPGLASKTKANITIPVVSIVKGVTFGLIDLTSEPELLNNVQVTKNDIPDESDLDEGWSSGLIADLFYVHKQDQGDGVTRIQQRMIGIGLEDPATGAASAALCSYLATNKGGSGTTHVFELEQGVQMGRRSIIGCEVTLAEDGDGLAKVVLSGRSQPVMKGELSF